MKLGESNYSRVKLYKRHSKDSYITWAWWTAESCGGRKTSQLFNSG